MAYRSRKREKKPVSSAWKLRLFLQFSAVALLVLVGYLFYLNQIVVARFQGQKWELPSHVYARPLELYEGMAFNKEEIVWELDSLGYRAVTNVQAPGQYSISSNRMQIYSRGFDFWDGVDPAILVNIDLFNSSIQSIRDRNFRLVPIFRLEPMRIGGIYSDSVEDRLLLKLEEIPELVQRTLLAVEDQDFYAHFGVSPKAILRALVANLRPGATLQGGSTLTQQLVKNFYLSSERTLTRKAQEALMAILLDLHFDKQAILEAYFNEVYFGQSGSRAINGIGLASHYYFRQPLEELDLHQVAFLIGIIKGPGQYDPWKNSQRALDRRNLVLQVMQDEGIITPEQAATYKMKSLDVAVRPGSSLNPYPGFMQMVREQLLKDYDLDHLQTGGLKIFSTLDPMIQRKVQTSVSQQLESLEKGYKLDSGVLQSAVVVTQVGSGEILALLGDRQPGYNGFNRALEAKRPIGSLIKPVLYLTALNRPQQYTLISLLSDEPLSVPSGSTVWTPENFDHLTHGLVPLYQALANSYNLSSARLGLEVGVEDVLETLRFLGVEHDMPAYPSMLLGAGALTPMEVSKAYHTIAADGFYTPPSVIRGVYTSNNEPLKRYERQVEQRIDPRSIHLLQYAMQTAMLEGTGKRVYQQFSPQIHLAGKTGTTNDQRDSWFAGFGGTYLTVVWMGRDDNGKTPLTGSTGALSVWQKIMYGLENRSVAFTHPEGVDYYWVEPSRQALSAEGCPGAVYVPFISGSEPSNRSPCAPDRSLGETLKDFLGL